MKILELVVDTVAACAHVMLFGIVVLCLAGCTIRSSQPTPATPAPALQIPPPRVSVKLDNWRQPLTIRVYSEAVEMACRVDRLRSSRGKRYLLIDHLLMQAAQESADAWAADGIPTSADPPAEYRANSSFCCLATKSTAIEAIDEWLQTLDVELLNEKYTQAGYGLATDRDGKKYWVAILARPR